ncbi:MAG: heat-inducible transcriptional repressor HrcA [Eubacterium sp.]|nr:heat-inducible transcriptional repressor HrcA [Eubacterium sp.]
MGEDLDDRKKTILKAIIQTYLETGEPVGSRTISKYTELNLSSATIRNEMSDLEEMGYIIQPHTSSGRIPSDKGYRLYVNELIQKNNQDTDVQTLMIQKTDRMEKVLKQVVDVLAHNTNYATMIAGPSYHQNSLKFIQLSKVNDKQLLAVVVAQGNLVKNQVIDLREAIDDNEILKLNLLLNNELNGKTIGEINLDTITRMKQQAGIHSEVISSVIDAVAETIQPGEDDMPIYLSGATNIFDYPELSDSKKAKELMTAFSDKKELAEMIRETAPGEESSNGITAYIGNESPIQGMKDCSVVTANYNLGNGMKGTVAIVGPRRMDYKKVVDNLKQLKAQMNALFGNGDAKLEDSRANAVENGESGHDASRDGEHTS